MDSQSGVLLLKDKVIKPDSYRVIIPGQIGGRSVKVSLRSRLCDI
jgi:hypothetical protein